MKIYFSPTTTNNYHIISNYPHNSLRINNTIYPVPKNICFFHLFCGNYINGYDKNGKRLFSIQLPLTLTFVHYCHNHIKY